MNLELLKSIGNAQAANALFYVSQGEGLPLVQHSPPLIAVDPGKVDPADASKIAAILTDAGIAFVAAQNAPIVAPSGAAIAVQMGGFVRPKAKRGGGRGTGAPAKYPFDTLEIGQFFFVANSEVAKGDAFKTLGSAVGSANQRYSEGTGEHEQVTRAKRGSDHKTVKDENGNNVMETVTLEKKRSLRKFAVSKVEAGKVYGSFTAPSDGAVVIREALKDAA